jgi:hypothetical protein
MDNRKNPPGMEAGSFFNFLRLEGYAPQADEAI